MLTEKGYDATDPAGRRPPPPTTPRARSSRPRRRPGSTRRRSAARCAAARSARSTRCRPRSRRSRSTASAPTQRVRAGEEVDARAAPGHRPRARRARRAARPATFDLDVSVRCSSGTYIRAIARDLGAALGVGGHLTALRRTAVGPVRPGRAHTLDELADDFAMMPIAEAARAAFPAMDLDERAGRRRPVRSAARARSAGADGGVRPRRRVPGPLRAARRPSAAPSPSSSELVRWPGRRPPLPPRAGRRPTSPRPRR